MKKPISSRREKSKTITAADLFCGGGGTSTGLAQACKRRGHRLQLLAVNHWEIAIATHETNHPNVEHLCMNVDQVDPRKAIPSGKLDLLVASPECIYHSRALGGRPVNDQSRASAWLILRWCEALDIKNVLIENVLHRVKKSGLAHRCGAGTLSREPRGSEPPARVERTEKVGHHG